MEEKSYNRKVAEGIIARGEGVECIEALLNSKRSLEQRCDQLRSEWNVMRDENMILRGVQRRWWYKFFISIFG